MTTLLENQYLIIKHYKKFDNIFHADIEDYIGLMDGFSVEEFKKYIDCPRNKNLNKFLEDKYGEDAVELIEEISQGKNLYWQ